VSAPANALRNFWLAPLVGAALLWASFAPLDLGLLAPLGWAVLFLSMRLRGGERAGRQALVGQFAFFLAGIWWIAPLVSVGWVFVAFWCAAYEAIFARCLRPSLRAARDGGGAAWVLTAPLLHLLFDVLRTVVASGFPWLIPGYSGWSNPVLLGSADLIGVHGSTLAIVGAGAGLAEVAARAIEGRSPRWGPAIPAAALWAALAAWAFGKPAIEERPGPSVLLLQAAIPQELKEDRLQRGGAEVTDAVFWNTQESVAAEGFASGAPVDLVVWPETMLPVAAAAPLVPGRPMEAFEQVAGTKRWRIGDSAGRRAAAAARGRPTLAGVMTVDRITYRKRNSAVLLDGDGRVVAHQDKQHLTPGGETLLFLEWLPAGLRREVEARLMEMAGFLPDLDAGEAPALLPVAWRGGTVRAGALICYESIFPELSRAMARDGADVLVNLSNYGWFTGTPQMDQALAMAAFRAAELRRPVVLASNNGISAVLGPDGRVRARTEPDVRTHLTAVVPLAAGVTPFSALGEWAAWALGALGAAMAIPRAALRLAGKPARAPETS
jgi:apolipoprotein N-acyltransferase